MTEILKPHQEVKIHVIYDGHDVSVMDIEHNDNSITMTKTEAQYLRDVLNYLLRWK